ncbi:BTB/POZ domain-containing protein 1 [Golovinomyces cichoracearum]|uniref:BTB/POZ domain-containing protein 1 n=1 Tax=Golovinomyces cichoracearum TaxID=62708 RepID=A0A420ITX5_9PEZI|nr:BTB/POZ domain-containing protein 1 [Golovinomyces cichoracearum]
MSHLLWECYYNEELDKFKRLLSNGINDVHQHHSVKGGNSNNHGSIFVSTKPFKDIPNQRKISARNEISSRGKESLPLISRADINNQDYAGLTILHRAVSSTAKNMNGFAIALVDHPAIDLHVKDNENGWTALHRALYFGNATVARAILQKEVHLTNGRFGGFSHKIPSSLIKARDNEGYSAFDLFNATISNQPLNNKSVVVSSDDETDDESIDEILIPHSTSDKEIEHSIDGDEVLAWGSNRNFGLGFRDQDDRQHPEKIALKRPDHLLFRFYQEYKQSLCDKDERFKNEDVPTCVSDLPTLITNRPIMILDVVLSKLHSAILTTDPESNLYMCGFGPGGRLGTGDQDTRFSYVPVNGGALAGMKVTKIALGQSHTLAILDDGSIISWGSNIYCQLGYYLPRSSSDNEELISSIPRAICGPLKREYIKGVAASACHSVAYTSNSLYTWGRNQGQLGLAESESRGLEHQSEPRKVATFLLKVPISSVAAIDNATIVLLSNHTVFVLSHYGHKTVKFPSFEDSYPYNFKGNSFRNYRGPESNHISSITAGGNTIGAITTKGDLFTFNVRTNSSNILTDTTSPGKLRDPLSLPERVWSLRKGDWDGIKSAAITEHGCIIVCTRAGIVWRRFKQVKAHDSYKSDATKNRKKFKFERISGLAKIAAVRSNVYGVYVAIQKIDKDTETGIQVEDQNIWADIKPLMIFNGSKTSKSEQESDVKSTLVIHNSCLPSFLTDLSNISQVEISVSKYLLHQHPDESLNIDVGTSTSKTNIPVHSFILRRSSVLSKALRDFRRSQEKIVNDNFIVEKSTSSGDFSRILVTFKEMSFIALLNLVVYLYTDTLFDSQDFNHNSCNMSRRYRDFQDEVIKTASYLGLDDMKTSIRLLSVPKKRLSVDMYFATLDPFFFEDCDTELELKDSEVMMAHSAVLCRRCPFFEGLFNGRAAGQWLQHRRHDASRPVRINLKHIQGDVFRIVLCHIYSDTGIELFNDINSADIDEFSCLVLDVLAVADELMLNRLSQICQKIISDFINNRNICNLLNIIAPCSVSVFKDFALKYICQNLESILENHFLDELEDNLLLELDEVIRRNQLNCLPFAKSGMADSALLSKYPCLVEEIKEERIRRTRDSAFLARMRDDRQEIISTKASSCNLGVVHSNDSSDQDLLTYNYETLQGALSTSTLPNHSIKDKITCANEKSTFSLQDSRPSIPRSSFDISSSEKKNSVIAVPDTTYNESISVKKDCKNQIFRLVPSSEASVESRVNKKKCWSSFASTSSKLNLQEIMAQAKSNRPSTSLKSPKSQKPTEELKMKLSPCKVSQKKRKEKHHQKVSNKLQASLVSEGDQKNSPWQTPVRDSQISLKEITSESPSGSTKVHNFHSPPSSNTGHVISCRNSSMKQIYNEVKPQFPTLIQKSQADSRDGNPHLKQNIVSVDKAEAPLQSAMIDIIGQQIREQEIIKEAIAKRSLREIQEEQAFQEWWDQESNRVQIEEAARANSVINLQNKEKNKYRTGPGMVKARSSKKGRKEKPGRNKSMDGINR